MGGAHSKVATFEKIDKRTIGNRLAPQIGKRTIDHAKAQPPLRSIPSGSAAFALAVHEKRQRDRRD